MMKFHLKLWTVAVALIVGGVATHHGSAVRADELGPSAAGEAEAVGERFDALIEQAASRLAGEKAGSGEAPAEVAALRGELQTAQTQIEVLKAVVVEALLAQSSAESELGAIRGDAEAQLAAVRAERGEVEARNVILADELEAVTDHLTRLQAEVDALRGGAVPSPPIPLLPAAPPEPALPAGDQSGSLGVIGAAAAATADAVGPVEAPVVVDEGSEPPADVTALAIATAEVDLALATNDDVMLAEVHFNPGSATLTPGGERKTLEAAERIGSMDVDHVRIVGYADTVGAGDANQYLSLLRADSIAVLLEDIGIPRDKILIVGRGEEGVPEPTADDISEPLNRCAGIFVVPAPVQ